MSTAFTPGPWRVANGINDERRVGYLVVAARSKMHGGGPAIVTARPAYRSVEANGEAEANARLIAAAPDLYAALLDLLEYQPCSRSHEIGRAAIAKARGEQ